MFEAKYIVTYHDHMEAIIMFPNFIKHTDFIYRLNIHHTAVLSAGFVKLRNDADGKAIPVTFGESVSLDIKSRSEDQRLAEEMFKIY